MKMPESPHSKYDKLLHENADYVCDIPRTAGLIPYLIHFGVKGITPEVCWVFPPHKSYAPLVLSFRRIKGPRLGVWLNQNRDITQLRELYRELGYRFGYIHKYNVFHNHSKTSNLIVDENGKPVIVDWKHGTVGARAYTQMPKGFIIYPSRDQDSITDSSMLLSTARGLLIEIDSKHIQELERAFHEIRIREMMSPLEITVEEIEHQAQEFLLSHSS